MCYLVHTVACNSNTLRLLLTAAPPVCEVSPAPLRRASGAPATIVLPRDRPSRPFRCLDAQYRRELVRVYLTNVESICRRFCDERRTRLGWLRSEGPAFRAWWRGLGQHRQAQLTQAKGDPILKGLVKQFFNEKEVTSTLVMDALFCGCKQLEKLSRSKVRRAAGRREGWLS